MTLSLMFLSTLDLKSQQSHFVPSSVSALGYILLDSYYMIASFDIPSRYRPDAGGRFEVISPCYRNCSELFALSLFYSSACSLIIFLFIATQPNRRPATSQQTHNALFWGHNPGTKRAGASVHAPSTIHQNLSNDGKRVSFKF